MGDVAISSSSGTLPMAALEPPNGFLPGKVLFAMVLYGWLCVSSPLLEDEDKVDKTPQ